MRLYLKLNFTKTGTPSVITTPVKLKLFKLFEISTKNKREKLTDFTRQFFTFAVGGARGTCLGVTQWRALGLDISYCYLSCVMPDLKHFLKKHKLWLLQMFEGGATS